MLSTSTSFGGLRRRQKITSDIIFYLYSVLFKLYLYCVKVRLNIPKCLWSWGKPIDNQDCYYSMDNFHTTNTIQLCVEELLGKCRKVHYYQVVNYQLGICAKNEYLGS